MKLVKLVRRKDKKPEVIEAIFNLDAVVSITGKNTTFVDLANGQQIKVKVPLVKFLEQLNEISRVQDFIVRQ
jgi:hypothetical protein